MAVTWREDGGDYYTGCQATTPSGAPRGPGGMVAWRVDPYRYTASAWVGEKSCDKDFKTVGRAKVWVERWLLAATTKRAK